MKHIIVFGTRPEIIKYGPILKELKKMEGEHEQDKL